MINQGTNREKTSNEREGGDIDETTGSINRKTGSDADASMDPTETYPVIISVSANTKRQRGSAMAIRVRTIFFIDSVWLPIGVWFLIFFCAAHGSFQLGRGKGGA